MAWRPSLRIRDPQRAFLHRGIRVAIAVPVIALLVVRIADDPEGLLYGSFLAVVLLGLTDIGGPWVSRAVTPLVAAALATVFAVVGILASTNLVTAVAVTFVVGSVLAFLPTLRGRVAAIAPALLLVYAASVTTRVPLESLPDVVVGLAISGVVSAITALVVFPDDPQRRLRRLLAAAMRAQADFISARWLGAGDEQSAGERYRSAVANVDSAWIGNPYRPSGTAESHHALILLASRLRVIFQSLQALPAPEPDDPPAHSIQDAVDWMRRNAAATEGTGPLPDIDDLVGLRAASRQRAIERTQRQTDPVTAIGLLRRTHVGQMLLAFAGQTTALVADCLGRPVATETERVIEPARWWTDLAVNATPRSPWLRSALRAGLGLAIAAGVVSVAGLDHGFWVLLGVVSVLRIDAAATSAQAVRAIAGTIVGVGLGLATLALVGGLAWAPWLLLPLAAFLAGWAGGALGFGAGQAAFSLFVLVMVSTVEWPPDYSLAVTRLVDVVVGVVVAAVVALLVWPGNVLPALRADLAAALRAGVDYLGAAVDRMAGRGAAADLRERWVTDRAVTRRTAETFDICVLQRRDVDAVRGYWAQLMGDAHLLLFTGALIGAIPDVATKAVPAHASVLREQGHAARATWDGIALRCAAPAPAERASSVATDPIPGDHGFDDLARASADLDLGDARVAASLASSVWVLDWLALLDDAANQVSAPPDG